MDKFVRYFKEHRNKILAITFSALALALFLGYYAVLEIASGGFYFRRLGDTGSVILELWNFFFYAVLVFGGLLYRNINNDGRAYQNILIFVFSIALNVLINLIFGSLGLLFDNDSVNPVAIIVVILSLSFSVAQLIFGVLLYLNVLRYMRGYSIEWRKIRTLAIIFSIIVCLGAFPFVGIELLLGAGPLSFLDLSVSQALCSIAIIFTLERLRRY